jgi:hypothetical protein
MFRVPVDIYPIEAEELLLTRVSHPGGRQQNDGSMQLFNSGNGDGRAIRVGESGKPLMANGGILLTVKSHAHIQRWTRSPVILMKFRKA